MILMQPDDDLDDFLSDIAKSIIIFNDLLETTLRQSSNPCHNWPNHSTTEAFFSN